LSSQYDPRALRPSFAMTRRNRTRFHEDLGQTSGDCWRGTGTGSGPSPIAHRPSPIAEVPGISQPDRCHSQLAWYIDLVPCGYHDHTIVISSFTSLLSFFPARLQTDTRTRVMSKESYSLDDVVKDAQGKMRYINLGPSGLRVSRISLGMMS
jgi:hypothetical protein